MSSDIDKILSSARSDARSDTHSADARHDENAQFLAQLEQEPYKHGLFATLRRLECLSADTPRIGQSVRPGEDCVRLGQQTTLAFSASQLAEFSPRSGKKPPRLLVNAPGLFGPNGPLPIHLTEYVYERRKHFGDDSMWRFIDIFHHRMLSLLYRAWANTQPTVNADRKEDDRFTRYVASLMGLGLESLENRDAFPDNGRLHYVGHLARQSRSPQGLLGAIEDFFDVTVSIRQFVGEWMDIPQSARWQLGKKVRDGGLGFGTTLGESVWSCQHKFTVVVGPVDYETFCRFLPGSENSNRLAALVRTFCGDEYDWDLQLILKKEEIPLLQLGQQGLLGRTSWLRDDNRTEDAIDVQLHPTSGVWQTRAA